MKKGLLLYSDIDYKKNIEFAKRFLDKCENFGLKIDLALESDIKYGICENNFYCEIGNLNIKNNYNFAINRTRNALLALTLENIGVRVLNSSKITAICNDKNTAYIKAAKNGVPCLNTFFYDKDNIDINKINFPVVLKQPFGHGGNNVYLCKDKKQFINAINIINGRFVTVQQKLNTEEVSDIRVFIMGNNPIYAVKRTSVSSFKANYCQGGKIALYDIDTRLKCYIKKLFNIGYFDYAGFDFLYDGKDYFFNEIEDAVGSRSLCILKNIDTCELYLEYINKILNA